MTYLKQKIWPHEAAVGSSHGSLLQLWQRQEKPSCCVVLVVGVEAIVFPDVLSTAVERAVNPEDTEADGNERVCQYDQGTGYVPPPVPDVEDW